MLQLSCTQKPASHDRQNGSKRCHGKGDFGMKVAMIGHKDFPSRSGGVEVMVGGLATSLVRRGYEVTVYNRGLQKGHNVYTAVQMRQPLPCNLIREKYGLEAGSYILYVGRISPEKGPLDLVEGYLKAHTDKKLVLAGPFAETEYCTTVQEKIAGNPNIITTGYVVGDALLELYSNCALFVLPSHTEGLSLSLLEALSLGVKCLVSDIPENTTVTADYGTAFRTEDTDSLARALERDTARPLTPEQSKAQLDYVRANFDYDVMLDRYEEVYHHVIGDPLKEIPSQAKAHSKAAAAQGGAA